MLQSLFDSTTLPLLEKVAIFGERRQEALAGNIANIDTPGYRRRDLPVAEFQAALKSAVAAKTSPGASGSYAAGTEQTSEPFSEDLFRPARIDAANITFQDGNDRSIEYEVMEMTKNAMRQNFAIETLVAQMSMLETAISERV